MFGTDLGFMQNINWVDFLAAGIFLRCLYIGLKKGFAVEFFKFAGLIAGLIVGGKFCGQLAVVLTDYLPLDGDKLRVLAYAGLVFGVVLAFGFIRLFAQLFMRMEFAPSFDKIGGGVLGIVRGGLISGIIFSIMVSAGSGRVTQSIVSDSLFGGRLLRVQEVFSGFQIRRDNDS